MNYNKDNNFVDSKNCSNIVKNSNLPIVSKEESNPKSTNKKSVNFIEEVHFIKENKEKIEKNDNINKNMNIEKKKTDDYGKFKSCKQTFNVKEVLNTKN